MRWIHVTPRRAVSRAGAPRDGRRRRAAVDVVQELLEPRCASARRGLPPAGTRRRCVANVSAALRAPAGAGRARSCAIWCAVTSPTSRDKLLLDVRLRLLQQLAELLRNLGIAARCARRRARSAPRARRRRAQRARAACPRAGVGVAALDRSQPDLRRRRRASQTRAACLRACSDSERAASCATSVARLGGLRDSCGSGWRRVSRAASRGLVPEALVQGDDAAAQVVVAAVLETRVAHHAAQRFLVGKARGSIRRDTGSSARRLATQLARASGSTLNEYRS